MSTDSMTESEEISCDAVAVAELFYLAADLGELHPEATAHIRMAAKLLQVCSTSSPRRPDVAMH